MKKNIVTNFLFAVLALGSIMVSSCSKKEQIVKIEDAPGPNFEASKVLIKPGETVDFTSTSTGNITSYIWSFPGADVTTSKEKDPKGIMYSKPGRYTVSLTTNGPSGSNTTSRLEYIFVNGLDLPLTLDAKDSIQNFGGTPRLFKTGTLANLNPNLRYTIRVVYSNTSTTPYNIYDDGEFVNVKADGKISFSIRLNKKVTNYRLYIVTNGQADEFYSATSTYTVPEPIFQDGSVTKFGSGITVSGKYSSSLTFASLNNFYDFGIVWKVGTQAPTIDDNKSGLFPNSVSASSTIGSFSDNVIINQVGDVRFRFYAKIENDVIYFEPVTGGIINFP